MSGPKSLTPITLTNVNTTYPYGSTFECEAITYGNGDFAATSSFVRKSVSLNDQRPVIDYGKKMYVLLNGTMVAIKPISSIFTSRGWVMQARLAKAMEGMESDIQYLDIRSCTFYLSVDDFCNGTPYLPVDYKRQLTIYEELKDKDNWIEDQYYGCIEYSTRRWFVETYTGKVKPTTGDFVIWDDAEGIHIVDVIEKYKTEAEAKRAMLATTSVIDFDDTEKNVPELVELDINIKVTAEIKAKVLALLG